MRYLQSSYNTAVSVTPLAELLAAEIRAGGPVPFSRYMRTALYHPEHGYYRRQHDPFGKAGDFYTAEQLQPAFGLLMREYVRGLRENLGAPGGFTLVEMGAGREEMGVFFREFGYIPVDVDRGALPRRFQGVLFANEFFDALPVDVAVRRGAGYREMRVDCRDGAFCWSEGEAVDAQAAGHLAKYGGDAQEGDLRELNFDTLRSLDEIARSMESGYLLVIDYGYTTRELVRFPQGTLMSYQRHTASEDVLCDPGSRDITAHVDFSALEAHAATHGFKQIRFEPLALALMRAGEKDNFATVLEGADEAQRLRARLQLKTLLYGMGETFRTLLLAR